MMQREFEAILGEKVTESDYRLIEIVYQWYPGSLNKEKIASLYKDFGMALIRDMLPRADMMKEMEGKIGKAKHDVWTYEKLIEVIKSGCDLKELEVDVSGKT